jgi:hypothetical protein
MRHVPQWFVTSHDVVTLVTQFSRRHFPMLLYSSSVGPFFQVRRLSYTSRNVVDKDGPYQCQSQRQGQGRQKSRTPGRALAFIAEAALLCNIPPPQDPSPTQESQVPPQIHSPCTKNGPVPYHRIVRSCRLTEKLKSSSFMIIMIDH